jgi:hypothetical protein
MSNAVELEISCAYLNEERDKRGRDVQEWIMQYARRNKIQTRKSPRVFGARRVDVEPYLILTFRSDNQLEWFVRKGNQSWPYFEFI